MEDGQGHAVPFEVVEASGPSGKVNRARVRLLATVPGLGYATVYITPRPIPCRWSRSSAPPARSSWRTSTSASLITAASGGGIVSLFDKALDRDLINPASGPANELISIEEDIANHPEPPWEVMTKVGGRRYHSRDLPHAPRKSGAARSPVASARRPSFKDCRRVQETVVIRGLRRVEFTTDLVRYRGK